MDDERERGLRRSAESGDDEARFALAAAAAREGRVRFWAIHEERTELPPCPSSQRVVIEGVGPTGWRTPLLELDDLAWLVARRFVVRVADDDMGIVTSQFRLGAVVPSRWRGSETT